MSARVLRSSIALAIALGASLPSTARAQMPPSPPLVHAPGDGVHVDGYIGMEFVTLGRTGGGANYEQFTVRGVAREPYILKVADLHFSGLGRFEAGLNAAATSFAALGGFTSESQTTQADLGDAERYAGLIGYALGKHVTLRGEALYARLVTYASPSFHRTGDISLTTYYVPQDGSARRLAPGANVLGNTDWYSARASVIVDGKAVGVDWLKDMILGYRLVRVSTLSSYLVSQGDYVSSFMQGVVNDTFQCHAVSARANTDWTLWDDLHLVMHADFFLGYSSVSSAFVDASGGMCLGRGGTLALVYAKPHVSFIIGYNYEEVTALQFVGGSTLQGTYAYSEPNTARAAFARKGSTFSVDSPAQSFQVIGPFTRLTISY